jgi:hypothetical protein
MATAGLPPADPGPPPPLAPFGAGRLQEPDFLSTPLFADPDLETPVVGSGTGSAIAGVEGA